MFEGFQSFIPKTIKTLNLEKQTTAAHSIFIIQTEINTLLPHLKQKYKALSLKNSILKIYCQHPIVAQEIITNQNQLKNSVNQKLGDNTIKHIYTTTQIDDPNN